MASSPAKKKKKRNRDIFLITGSLILESLKKQTSQMGLENHAQVLSLAKNEVLSSSLANPFLNTVC